MVKCSADQLKKAKKIQKKKDKDIAACIPNELELDEENILDDLLSLEERSQDKYGDEVIEI